MKEKIYIIICNLLATITYLAPVGVFIVYAFDLESVRATTPTWAFIAIVIGSGALWIFGSIFHAIAKKIRKELNEEEEEA